jgi:tetratricopeptide (TPR) repeat protein
MAPLIKSNALVSAVLAGLPAVVLLGLSSQAHGQYQIQSQNGHLLDANNRIGSGGFNGPGTQHDNYNVNNNVVTGNVSGLNYFHDNKTTEFDSNTFQGATGSSSFSGFDAASTPINYAKRDTGTPNYVPYYNVGTSVGAPPNYVTTPGGTGYIPAPKVSPLTPTDYDSRLELTNQDPTKGNLLPPDQLDVAGPVDPSSGTQSMYSMSPLYGVRQNDPFDNSANGAANGTNGAPGSEDTFYNGKYSNVRTNNAVNRATLTPAAIQRMRDELNNTVVPSGQSNNTNVTTPPVAGSTDVSQGQQLNTKPTGTSDQIAGQALTSSVTNPQLNGNLTSGESVQNQLIIAPSKQSKQIEELEKRYAAKSAKSKLTDVDATNKFNEEVRLQKTASEKFDAAQQKAGTLGAIGTDTTAGAASANKPDKTAVLPAAKPILTTPEASEENQSYIITSLATGISAKGLADLMKTAEDQMRAGKFTEAVDTYQTAEQVAPNNPFVSLGRGFAELGASYYGKADQDISRAINADPAILVGRYDLKGFLGEDRLSFVEKDLQDIASSEKGARPLVLLGYMAHNTGDDAAAAKDFDDAMQRGGYNDLIKLMKQAWSIR